MNSPADVAPLIESRQRTRFSFNYGWVMVGVGALAMTATLPGRTHGLGLITEPLLGDLGIERTLLGRINLVTCLLGTVFCLPVGYLLDRFGIRAALACVLLGLGVSVIGMSAVTGPIMLAVALLFVRGLGQSALSIVSMAAVGKWFRERRLGIAMGVYSVLLTFGFIGSVVWLGSAVEKVGWRSAWSQLGWILLVGVLPLSLILTRDPNQDAAGSDAEMVDHTEPRPLADFTFGQALRAPAFWVIAIGSAAFNLVWSALTFFNQSILEERGFDSGAAIKVMAILVGTGLLSNLVGGVLARRERIRWLLGVGLVILAVSLASFPSIASLPALLTYAAAIGITGGLVTVVYFTAWGAVFGRAHLGRIQGMAQLITVVASAAGPDLLAESHAMAGSYTPMFYILAAASGGLALAAFIVRLPRARP